MKSLLQSVTATVLVTAGCQALAQDLPGPVQDAKAPQAESGPVAEDFSTLRTNCYTNVRDCAGLATWRNTDARAVSCSVWWNNGANGRSNFVLLPGQTAGYHVRFNDTTSCVWIEQGPPPPGAQRYYIYVQ
jgi:hypothetical protein